MSIRTGVRSGDYSTAHEAITDARDARDVTTYFAGDPSTHARGRERIYSLPRSRHTVGTKRRLFVGRARDGSYYIVGVRNRQAVAAVDPKTKRVQEYEHLPIREIRYGEWEEE